MNPINIYYSPEELIKSFKEKGLTILDVGSIGISDVGLMKKHTDFILPLHETNNFFILAKRAK